MERKFRLRPLLCLLLAASIAHALSYAADNPKGAPHFTDTVRVLESQPIQGAWLAYFDQSMADLLGIELPPGRVGTPEFDAAVLKQLAFEIKEKSARVFEPTSRHDSHGKPLLFVEEDAQEGAGRAAYVPIGEKGWVNIKGIGITGAGNTSYKPAGPPSENFQSHSDGSATLEEAIKEAVMARTADIDTKNGASRVVAIIGTGRKIKYENGNEAPLALIVRAPLRRYDHGEELAADVVDSLAQANTRRLMKGDFVNRSSMGGGGEFVDFGCMTGMCGFVPAKSSQHQEYLFEGDRIIPMVFSTPDGLMYRRIGEHLLNQLGIPEAHVQALKPTSKASIGHFASLARAFEKLIYGQGEKFELDYAQVPQEILEGNTRIHEWFRDIAADFFAAKKAPTEAEFIAEQSARAKSLTRIPIEDTQKLLSEFAKELYPILSRLKAVLNLKDPIEYGKKIRQIAHFKNRDLSELVRPTLFANAGNVAREARPAHDGARIQGFIDYMSMNNRLGTAPAADSSMITRADNRKTEIFVRAATGDDGKVRLFQYPELPGAGSGERMYFRVSTDGWKSYHDLPAETVYTKMGQYLKISIPHGSMPVTEAALEYSPFVRDSSGNIRWLKSGLNLRGPPILFNERLGLPADFVKTPGQMRMTYGLPISIVPSDLDSKDGGEIDEMYQRYYRKLKSMMKDPDHLVSSSAEIQAQFVRDLYHQTPKGRIALPVQDELSLLEAFAAHPGEDWGSIEAKYLAPVPKLASDQIEKYRKPIKETLEMLKNWGLEDRKKRWAKAQVNHLLSIFRDLEPSMAGKVADASFRSASWKGGSKELMLTPLQLENLEHDPYLKIIRKKITPSGNFAATIEYPSVRDYRRFEGQLSKGLLAELQKYPKADEALNRRFIRELLESFLERVDPVAKDPLVWERVLASIRPFGKNDEQVIGAYLKAYYGQGYHPIGWKEGSEIISLAAQEGIGSDAQKPLTNLRAAMAVEAGEAKLLRRTPNYRDLKEWKPVWSSLGLPEGFRPTPAQLKLIREGKLSEFLLSAQGPLWDIRSLVDIDRALKAASDYGLAAYRKNLMEALADRIKAIPPLYEYSPADVAAMRGILAKVSPQEKQAIAVPLARHVREQISSSASQQPRPIGKPLEAGEFLESAKVLEVAEMLPEKEAEEMLVFAWACKGDTALAAFEKLKAMDAGRLKALLPLFQVSNPWGVVLASHLFTSGKLKVSDPEAGDVVRSVLDFGRTTAFSKDPEVLRSPEELKALASMIHRAAAIPEEERAKLLSQVLPDWGDEVQAALASQYRALSPAALKSAFSATETESLNRLFILEAVDQLLLKKGMPPSDPNYVKLLSSMFRLAPPSHPKLDPRFNQLLMKAVQLADQLPGFLGTRLLLEARQVPGAPKKAAVAFLKRRDPESFLPLLRQAKLNDWEEFEDVYDALIRREGLKPGDPRYEEFLALAVNRNFREASHERRDQIALDALERLKSLPRANRVEIFLKFYKPDSLKTFAAMTEFGKGIEAGEFFRRQELNFDDFRRSGQLELLASKWSTVMARGEVNPKDPSYQAFISKVLQVKMNRESLRVLALRALEEVPSPKRARMLSQLTDPYDFPQMVKRIREMIVGLDDVDLEAALGGVMIDNSKNDSLNYFFDELVMKGRLNPEGVPFRRIIAGMIYRDFVPSPRQMQLKGIAATRFLPESEREGKLARFLKYADPALRAAAQGALKAPQIPLPKVPPPVSKNASIALSGTRKRQHTGIVSGGKTRGGPSAKSHCIIESLMGKPAAGVP